MKRRVSILRLSHRIVRDKRVTTHLALVSRAFGAKCMYYTGDRDVEMENKIVKVNETWGGEFKVVYITDPYKFVRNWKKDGGTIVHLTMYGIPLIDVINDVREYDEILTIVGSEKVDPFYYKMADFNISITNQPHSEIAAVAIFLDYYFDKAEFKFEFKNPKLKAS